MSGTRASQRQVSPDHPGSPIWHRRVTQPREGHGPLGPLLGCRHDLPPVRRPRRLLHRGRRRPRPDPSQRSTWLGRPGGRGAGEHGPTTSATPTSRSEDASWDAILAEQLETALALEPDLVTVYAGANDILRPRGRPRRAGGAVRRGAGPARRDRGPTAGVDGVRPGRLGGLPADAWPVRALQRAGAGECRPARRDDRRLLADAGLPRLALLGPRPDAHGRRPDTSGWRPRCSRRSTCRTQCRHPALAEEAVLTPRERRRADLDWARSFAVPWVHRRLTGRSSGDAISPRRPVLARSSNILTARPPRTGRTCGCSSVGRARPSQGRCREFESRHPLHK